MKIYGVCFSFQSRYHWLHVQVVAFGPVSSIHRKGAEKYDFWRSALEHLSQVGMYFMYSLIIFRSQVRLLLLSNKFTYHSRLTWLLLTTPPAGRFRIIRIISRWYLDVSVDAVKLLSLRRRYQLAPSFLPVVASRWYSMRDAYFRTWNRRYFRNQGVWMCLLLHSSYITTIVPFGISISPSFSVD